MFSIGRFQHIRYMRVKAIRGLKWKQEEERGGKTPEGRKEGEKERGVWKDGREGRRDWKGEGGRGEEGGEGRNREEWGEAGEAREGWREDW